MKKENGFPDIRSRWFSPLQMLELDACSRCGECVRVCPVVGEGYPEGAMERIAGWNRAAARSTGVVARLQRKPFDPSCFAGIYSSLSRCTTCGACSAVCESGISGAPLWESMRGAGREMGFCDGAGERTSASIRREKNPYNGIPGTRTAWIPPDIIPSENAEVGFFAGCTIAFRDPETGRAALRILAASGTEFSMLGEDESCCGSFLFRTGSYDGYQDSILSMIEGFRERRVKSVLFPCAGCLRTATIDWPRIYGRELPFTPVHFPVFLREMVRKGKIRFSTPFPRRLLYHDPCHGGRHLMHHLGRDNVFEAPREVIAAIPGLELKEFPQNREFQVCCGAGGGVKTGNPDLALSIGMKKMEHARSIHADLLVSTCPFCKRNLDDARIRTGSTVEVIDLSELVDRTMDRGGTGHER